MSLDRTLHMKSGVSSKRNVLKRPERIQIMQDNGRCGPESTVLSLPKTRVRHSRAGSKAKKEEAPAAEATPEAAEAPPAGISIPGRWWRYRRIHSVFGLKFWAFVVGAALVVIVWIIVPARPLVRERAAPVASSASPRAPLVLFTIGIALGTGAA